MPLARFVAKNIPTLGRPFKRYAFGSVFRGERPAKGRFREFLQCDFDVVGTNSLVSDAEVVQAVHATLSKIGVPPFTISLNHRQILAGLFRQLGVAEQSGRLLRSIDKLAKIGRAAVIEEMLTASETNPEADEPRVNTDEANQILDFIEAGRGGLNVLDRITPTLADQPASLTAIEEMRILFQLIEAGGVPIDRLQIDVGLARGLDYYTGMVLETTVNGWEKFGSIASGGRYDNLTRLFTDQPLPGVGASIGLDRLLALFEEAGLLKGPATSVPVLIPHVSGVAPQILIALGARLRGVGIGAEVYPDPIPTGKQMQYGSTRGHRFAVIVGPEEQSTSVFNLRELATRVEQKQLPLADLESIVRAAIETSVGGANP